MLLQNFSQQQPTFGVGLLTAAGGEIRLGDSVALV
jgi:hypothetical protein